MPGVEMFFEYAAGLLLIMARVAGIFSLSPLISGTAVPRRLKLYLTMFFGMAAFFSLPDLWRTGPDMTLVEVAVLAVRELLVGVSIGFVASFPVMAAQMVGMIAGHQVGLSLAQSFNPATNANSGVFEAMMFYLAIGIFATLGGLEMILLLVLESYETIPLAGLTGAGLPLELIVEVMTSGFEMAIRGSAPVVGIIMIETVTTAVLMRTIPGINIMSVGFAIKICVGVVVLASAIAGIAAVIGGEFDRAFMFLTDWINAGGGVQQSPDGVVRFPNG